MSNKNTLTSDSRRPIIAVLTDFGWDDGDVSVMKGVMLGIVPGVHLIDITHAVAPQHVDSAAWILATGYRYWPSGTIFLCVIDPGVGSTRRPVAVHAGDWYFVGPDNGLFHYILVEQEVHGAVVLSNPTYHRSDVSATFHGRDIFAPAAAHLASGVALHQLGTTVDPATLQRLSSEVPTRQGKQITGRIVHVDHFGNLLINIPLSMIPDLYSSPKVQLHFPAKNIVITERRRFFAEHAEPIAGDPRPFIYGDSSGYLGVAVQNGSAARTLNIGRGAVSIVTLSEE